MTLPAWCHPSIQQTFVVRESAAGRIWETNLHVALVHPESWVAPKNPAIVPPFVLDALVFYIEHADAAVRVFRDQTPRLAVPDGVATVWRLGRWAYDARYVLRLEEHAPFGAWRVNDAERVAYRFDDDGNLRGLARAFVEYVDGFQVDGFLRTIPKRPEARS